MKKNLYLVEYYTKNPETGEGGWEIRLAWVMAYSKMGAEGKLSRHDPELDALITIEEHSEIVPLHGVPNPLILL